MGTIKSFVVIVSERIRVTKMSREIKFRAWYPNNKRMIYEADFKGDGIYDEKAEFWKRRYLNPSYRVMQYTGLKDKNGVEIYEGDILRCHIFVQEFGENFGVSEGEREFIGKALFGITGFNVEANGFRDNPVFYDEFHEESLEVIGNIYENSELLNGED